MWVALTRLLGLGLIIIWRVIVSLGQGLQFPRWTFFRHFSEEGHYCFVENIRVTIIDRLIGRDRTRESFWQHKLDTFTPRGLDVKEVVA